MEGLLIRLIELRPFWDVFGSLRPHLDPLYWCFANQPWMGPPAEFEEREEEDLEAFEGDGTGTQLWKPRTLGRYADRFSEEYIKLWAIDPGQDNPAGLATKYSKCGWSKGSWGEEIIREHARFLLLYTDSTCWEFYAQDSVLLDALESDLQSKSWLGVSRGSLEHRDELFFSSGLQGVWLSLNGYDCEPPNPIRSDPV